MSQFQNTFYSSPSVATENDEHISAILQQQEIYQVRNCFPENKAIDLSCRFSMVQWNYHLVDHYKLNREIVSIAMNHVDRFISTPIGSAVLKSRHEYQLLCLTALYIAVKNYESVVLSSTSLSKISRGVHTIKDIEDMESLIVEALGWRLNPPTAATFVSAYLEMAPFLKSQQRQAIFEIARFECEFAVSDNSCTLILPSIVAFAAVSNAFQALHLGSCYDTGFIDIIASMISIDKYARDVLGARKSLHNTANIAENKSENKYQERKYSSSKYQKLKYLRWLTTSASSPKCISVGTK